MSDAVIIPDRTSKPCDLCGGETYVWVTPNAAFRVCKCCGERWSMRPERPPITIREASTVIFHPEEDTLNDLTKLPYDDDERIHELGG
jgi:hypothetical protein